jgi:hypothetical protein
MLISQSQLLIFVEPVAHLSISLCTRNPLRLRHFAAIKGPSCSNVRIEHFAFSVRPEKAKNPQ